MSALIHDWAKRAPDAPAVTQGERLWSYVELVRAARALTAWVPAGAVVAVTGRPSFGLVASMLAVLAGNGVLLPIDPNLPAKRQRLLLQESAAQRLLAAGIPDFDLGLDAVLVHALTGQAGGATGSAGWRDPLPEDPAYIFFTSGTTGVPKGVLGCHKGLAHFLQWQQTTFDVGPGDRVAQLTGLGFDVVLRSIFLALTSGGTLCLPPAHVNFSGDSVLPWLRNERITILHTVPSLAQAWLNEAPPDLRLPALRAVFFAGEPLHGSLVRRWRTQFGAGGRVINLYGPTETTLAKFFYLVPAEPGPGVQPVGWPLPGTQALLFGEDNTLCPAGAAGEIVIRTPYRSLGYCNAPEEQARRFFPNPFNHDPTDLLYRTGDRGRFRADGALEILGRLDHQVKITGVRVEPDEVAAVIAQHPDVKACCVVAQCDPGQEPRLLAYLVAPGLPVLDLREFLREQLPGAMIPALFHFLDRLPLTPNGKVDRKALPSPVVSTMPFVEPETEIERLLAAVWQRALGVAQVGLADNFFELGGNSLRLQQVHSELRQLLACELPITKLFQYPTIQMLAGYLNKLQPALVLRQPDSALASPSTNARTAQDDSSHENDHSS